MNFVVEPDPHSLSARAAEVILAAARANPRLLLCAATGSTPTLTYQQLQPHQEIFSQARLIKLDEWHPLPASDPGSCEHYLQQHLVRPLNISPDRYFTFPGDTPDPAATCFY